MLGVYTYVGFAPLPKSLNRDDGREGVRCADGVDDDGVNDDDPSRKLEGGSFDEPIDGLVARGLLWFVRPLLPLPALILP